MFYREKKKPKRRLPPGAKTCKLRALSESVKQRVREAVASEELCKASCSEWFRALAPEKESGSVEYKWKLVGKSDERLQHLITQLKWRLEEGSGICHYEVGIRDDGTHMGVSTAELSASLITLNSMALNCALPRDLRVTIEKIRRANRVDTDRKSARVRIETEDHYYASASDSSLSFVYKGSGHRSDAALSPSFPLRSVSGSKVLDIRLCVCGNQAVGKSSLIGVLTSGRLDDARGSARLQMARHLHELFDSRTSTVSYHILGFDQSGAVVPNTNAPLGHEWRALEHKSHKVIEMYDTPGAEGCRKTAVHGLSASSPHYVMLVISPNDFDTEHRKLKRAKATAGFGQFATDSEDSTDSTSTGDPALSDDSSDSECGKEEVRGSEICMDKIVIIEELQRSDVQSKATVDAIDAMLSESKESSACDLSKMHHLAEGSDAPIEVLVKTKRKIPPVSVGMALASTSPPPSLIKVPAAISSPAISLGSATSEAFRSNLSKAQPIYHRYFALCRALNVPLFVVLNKCDDAKFRHRIAHLLARIQRLVARNSGDGMCKAQRIYEQNEAATAGRRLLSDSSTVPVFCVSCVTGEGLASLRTFLFSLRGDDTPDWRQRLKDECVFGVDNVFQVAGVGIVLGGLMRSGRIAVGDCMLLGPYYDGTEAQFRKVTVRSIHVRRRQCTAAFAGQSASVHVSELTCKGQVRRGMVLLQPTTDLSSPLRRPCFAFEAEMDVLYKCRLREGSQPIVHMEALRQAAHVLKVKPTGGGLPVASGLLSGGRSGVVSFAFCHRPEYVAVGMRILARKSRGAVCVGRVLRLLDAANKPLVCPRLLQGHGQKRQRHILERLDEALLESESFLLATASSSHTPRSAATALSVASASRSRRLLAAARRRKRVKRRKQRIDRMARRNRFI